MSGASIDTLYDLGLPVEALGDNATNAEVGQGMYDTFIAPLPTWLLVTWIVVAAVKAYVTSQAGNIK